MTKNRMLIPIAVLSIVIGWPGTVLAQSTREQPIPPRPATAVSPLIERYMLDELKALRTELAETRINLVREVTDRELKVAENVSNLGSGPIKLFA
jgi:hypothetical protein